MIAWYWYVVIGVVGLIASAVIGLLYFIYRQFVCPSYYYGLEGQASSCSNPCTMRVDPAKFSAIDPSFAKSEDGIRRMELVLSLSDAQPAIVVSTSPLIVAAYTEDMDCIALLDFSELPVAPVPRMNARLVCAAGYRWLQRPVKRRIIAPDLVEGVESISRFDNFIPMIADFISSDRKTLERLKQSIAEDKWKMLETLGPEQLSYDLAPPRDGRPSRCHMPTKGCIGWGMRMTLKALTGI
ncbi:MAG TPA: hypothetical protein PK402_03405 [Tepidisphaeraceae bacterium]|nr:hypothetical protein [Tepidisphaeraceae bacterium]